MYINVFLPTAGSNILENMLEDQQNPYFSGLGTFLGVLEQKHTPPRARHTLPDPGLPPCTTVRGYYKDPYWDNGQETTI